METATEKKTDEQKAVETYHKIEQDLWIDGAIDDLGAFQAELLDAIIDVAEKHGLSVVGGFKLTRVTDKELADLEKDVEDLLTEVSDEQTPPQD